MSGHTFFHTIHLMYSPFTNDRQCFLTYNSHLRTLFAGERGLQVTVIMIMLSLRDSLGVRYAFPVIFTILLKSASVIDRYPAAIPHIADDSLRVACKWGCCGAEGYEVPTTLGLVGNAVKANQGRSC